MQAECHRGCSMASVYLAEWREAHITPWLKCLCAAMNWAPIWQMPSGNLKWGSSLMSEGGQNQDSICHQSPALPWGAWGAWGAWQGAKRPGCPTFSPLGSEQQGLWGEGKGNTEDPRRVWATSVQYYPVAASGVNSRDPTFMLAFLWLFLKLIDLAKHYDTHL